MKALLETFRQLPTPFFYYNMNVLDDTIEAVIRHGVKKGYHIHYALKANNNDRVMDRIVHAGLGADCVSGNEIEWAIKKGFKPHDIAFAGVGKTDEEILMALQHDIGCFNCESVQEVEIINQLAKKIGKTARIAVRINPNVHANTHHYITTGTEENKFGIHARDLAALLEAMNSKWTNVTLHGLHFHIGSQIVDLGVFMALCEKVVEWQRFFNDKGFACKTLNVGGGLGINYHEPDQFPVPDFQSYFGIFERHLPLLPGQEMHFELGRSLTGQCGSLITRVLYVKPGVNTNFMIVDAGMTELIRPALYQAYHRIDVLNNAQETMLFDVVGPVCETSDTFARKRELPVAKRGDMVALRSCGAYGEVLNSAYNLRGKARALYSDTIHEQVKSIETFKPMAILKQDE